MQRPMQKLFVLALYFYNAKSYDANDCHFARNYDAASLFNSAEMQEEFLLRASWWQGAMARGQIGVQYATTTPTVWFPTDNVNPRGIVGIWRHGASGLTDGESEAIHLLLLAAALDGDIYALEFVKSAKNNVALESFTMENFILGMLIDKYRFYVEFAKRYPGYGGYLPLLTGLNLISLEPHENNELLASSNAMFCWAMIAVSQALRDHGLFERAELFQSYVNLLAETGLTVFLHNPDHQQRLMGQIRVLNRTAPVTKANYAPTEDCLKTPHSCDMARAKFEEPLLLFLFLYANWTSYGEGNAVKAEIRNRWNRSIKPETIYFPSSNIIVEKKHFFLADNMAKDIFLPYLDIPAAERLFLNKNRLRTIYSNYFGYPGLFGIAFGVTGCRIITPLIGEEAGRHGTTQEQVMPHGAFPLFLHPASRSYGVVWYATMLNSTYSQTSIGVMDSISITGNRTSHTISWNTGALTILAFGGRRTSDITRRYLLATNKYQQFYQLCEHRYIAVFGNDTLDGDGLSFALPSSSLSIVANYEQCEANVQSVIRSSQFCIDGDHCLDTVQFIQTICCFMSLPLIVLILYIAIVKHRSEKATHKWFTLHLFTVHLISVSALLIANLISFAAYFFNFELWNVTK